MALCSSALIAGGATESSTPEMTLTVGPSEEQLWVAGTVRKTRELREETLAASAVRPVPGDVRELCTSTSQEKGKKSTRPHGVVDFITTSPTLLPKILQEGFKASEPSLLAM